MNRRRFFQVGCGAVAGMSSFPWPPDYFMTDPPAGAGRALRLDPDAITVLMGYNAGLVGNLRQFPGWPGVELPAGQEPENDRSKWKKYSEARRWVEVWKSPEDRFVWTVEVPQAGHYFVYMLGTGRESIVEVEAGNRTRKETVTGWINNGWDLMSDIAHYPPREGKWRAEFRPPSDYFRFVWSGWDRMPIGTLYIPEGPNTITLRAKRVGGELALFSLELVRPAAERVLAEKANALRSDTQWLVDAKYGLFFHWTSTTTDDVSKATWPRRGERKVFPKNVEDFDVGPFVDMVRETGARYIVFSATWASHCFPAPIKAIDKILSGRTSKRDLIGEIADGLGEHGIKLMLYYHLGLGSDPEWWEKTKDRFENNWCAIVSEVGRRYGLRLAGWWFDGGDAYYQLGLSFERMAEAAKAGNPSRLVSYNSGPFLPKVTDFQDYLAGEGFQYFIDQSFLRHLPPGGSGMFAGGRHAGLQAHFAFPVEKYGWVHNRRDEDIADPLWEKDILVNQVKEALERKLVLSVAIEVYEDGTASPQTLNLLKFLREAIK